MIVRKSILNWLFGSVENPKPILVYGGPPSTWKILNSLFQNNKYDVLDIDRYLPKLPFNYIPVAIWYTLVTLNIKSGFSIAFIKYYSPKIVVTYIDNHLGFHQAARFCSQIRFLAIQNGSRIVVRDHGGNAKRIFHSEFACFGESDIAQYNHVGAKVKKYYPIGSLKDAFYRAQVKKHKLEKRFDLCFVSQIKRQHYKIYPKTMESLDLLAKYLHKFCLKHGTTICVAARRHPKDNAELYAWEENWYKERLGENVTVIPNIVEDYTSYRVIDESRVSLAMHTTLLREGFGRGNKVLSCNFTGDRNIDFPVNGPWSHTISQYELFETALLKLLNMTDDEYKSVCGNLPEFIIKYKASCPTDEFLKKLISDAVENKLSITV